MVLHNDDKIRVDGDCISHVMEASAIHVQRVTTRFQVSIWGALPRSASTLIDSLLAVMQTTPSVLYNCIMWRSRRLGLGVCVCARD